MLAFAGATESNVTVCDPLPTANDCCACAAFQFASPFWLASITHVPTAWKLTVVPESEQTDAALASMLKETARLDVALAATVYAAPPTTSVPLGVDENAIV